MLFGFDVLKKDIMQQFPGYQVTADITDDALDIAFGNDCGKPLLLHITDVMTLSFDCWRQNYSLTDDEYERLLWDMREVLECLAYVVSVRINGHLYITYLARMEMRSADDFINDDPFERSGLYKTGAVIDCVYRDERRNKQFVIEKG